MELLRIWLAIGLVTSVGTVGILTGCTDGGGENDAPFVDAALLERWRLTTIEMDDGTMQSDPNPNRRYTITFTQDQRTAEGPEGQELSGLAFRGFDGLNFLDGIYEVDANHTLAIPFFSSTNRGCLPGQCPALSTLFVEALQAASAYEVQGTRLRIVATDRENGTTTVLHLNAN